MKQPWLTHVFPIAAIFSFRMLGLFMLIPVFTVDASHLHSATPALIGIALGIYGLSQGLLQIPFGMLSDRYGRKPIIFGGLILFAMGSILGAISHSIYGMIFARTLQGSGAIGSVLIALLSDLTSDSQRTKAMAVIGVSIGLSFSLAMVISPIVTAHSGLSGIFYLTTLLALLGIVLLFLVIPNPKKEHFHQNDSIRPAKFKEILTNHHLIRLNTGIFIQHAILTATFFAIPMILKQHIQQNNLTASWHFYLPLMIFSFFMMVPFIIFAERKQQVKSIFLLAVGVTVISQYILSLAHPNWATLCAAMFLYFIAFNILEAKLPSLISKQADMNNKGTAMGVYSSCQFLGIFVGGTLAGITFQHFSFNGIFIMNGSLALLWLIIAIAKAFGIHQLFFLINLKKYS